MGDDFGVVFPDSDEGLTILTCDVSGHGAGSALMANRMYSETLHALERRMGPGALLRQLHDFVQDRIAVDGFYFTMVAARFTATDGRKLMSKKVAEHHHKAAEHPVVRIPVCPSVR